MTPSTLLPVRRAQAGRLGSIQLPTSRGPPGPAAVPAASEMLHRGGCTLCPDLGFINREEAIIALAEPDIEACQACNPQIGLT